jgi:hypothetical protein
MPEESKKSPSENFAEMMKNFGSALAEIFNDPKLKEKAKEFGESASDSAKAFAGRFKDEEVKNKFKDLGKAAKTFGESVTDYFKDDKEKSDSGQSDNQADSSQSGGTQPTGNQNSADEESKKKSENGLGSEGIVQPESCPDTASEKLLQQEEAGQPPNPDKAIKTGSGETAGNTGNAQNTIKKETAAGNTEGTLSENTKRYETDRNSRIAGYSAAIAWGIILIIFFNFFNRYIAFYTYDAALKTWSLTPMLTENFGAWLPIFNVSMAVSIIGSIVLIINDSFYINNVANIVMNIFGISSVVTLLTLFPFDFTSYQSGSLDPILFPIFKIGLALIIVGLSVGIFVRFIKIVIKIAKAS